MQLAAELGMILGHWIWGSKRGGEDLYLDASFPNWGRLWVPRECLKELWDGIMQCCVDRKTYGGQGLCDPLQMSLGRLQQLFLLHSWKYELEIGKEEL